MSKEYLKSKEMLEVNELMDEIIKLSEVRDNLVEYKEKDDLEKRIKALTNRATAKFRIVKGKYNIEFNSSEEADEFLRKEYPETFKRG